jgi:hypothetical protein
MPKRRADFGFSGTAHTVLEEQLMQVLRPRQETTENGFKPTDVTSFSLEWRRAED